MIFGIIASQKFCDSLFVQVLKYMCNLNLYALYKFAKIKEMKKINEKYNTQYIHKTTTNTNQDHHSFHLWHNKFYK